MYPSQVLNLKQASEKQQHVPQYIPHRTKLLALKILHPGRAGGMKMFCYSEYWLSSDRFQAIGKSGCLRIQESKAERGRAAGSVETECNVKFDSGLPQCKVEGLAW